jgi:23S rRNA (uridine2552-2'-O)-methyltransferase
LVVDLGAAPGAWSQYVRRKFAPKDAGTGGAAVGELNGTIIALDLLDFEPIEGVQFIQGDFREEAGAASNCRLCVGDRPVDVVISDMAPNLSGIGVTRCGPDRKSGRTGHRLCSKRHLKKDGALVCKVFHGSWLHASWWTCSRRSHFVW